MSEPLVSIIIPLYNAEKYIEETITSAINQTWPNKEIIVVDDGSTDNSLAMARRFETSNVKIIQQENRGASAARNKGLSIAKGAYIQFLDADDFLSTNKITDQMAVINGRQDYLSISRTVFFLGDKVDGDYLIHDENIEEYDSPLKFLTDMYNPSANTRGVVTVHSWLTPREIINKAGNWNEDLTVDDDGEFFCRAALAGKKIIHVPDAVNYYRRVPGSNSLSSQKHKNAMRSTLLANKLKYKHIKDASNNPFIGKAFTRLFMENAVTFYPEYNDLYADAIGMVNELGGTDYIPIIGGKKIELIKHLFGWKFARYLLFVFNKFK